MVKSLRANKDFKKFLKHQGYKQREADSKKQYFVNSEGKQVRIDFDTGMIAILDNKGFKVEESKKFLSTSF